MKKLTVIAILFILVLACSRKTVPSAPGQPVANTPDKPMTTPVATPTPPKTDTVQTAMLAHGKEVYTAKCGRCHKLYETTTYTADRWKPILDRMLPKARLMEADAREVTAYVMAGARK